jgi:hypothetical protein
MRTHHFVLSVVAVAASGSLSAAFAQGSTASGAAGAACASAAHRAFDFWAGSWDVEDERGVRIGTNRIELVLDGCALHESWVAGNGGRGHSYSAYDASRRRWTQAYFDRSGNVLLLEGAAVDGSIVMSGTTVSGGVTRNNRLTWLKLPDGRVHQKWEASLDGTAWRPFFEAWYRRSAP